MSAVSLLDAVAQREKALLEEIQAARAAGRREIESAQADASAVLLDNQHAIEREIQAMRQKSAQEREATIAAIEQASAERLAAIRAQADDRFNAIVDEVVARILPPVKGS